MGQRDLLTSKINDLVTSNDPALQYPSERFLELMLTRGVFLSKEDYRDIVAPAIEWAFERRFDHRLGKKTIRDALEVAGFTARAEAHQVLLEEFTAFLNRVQLDDRDDWYLHGIRVVIVALMANPACTEGAGALKTALRNVNRIQRSRTEVRD